MIAVVRLAASLNAQLRKYRRDPQPATDQNQMSDLVDSRANPSGPTKSRNLSPC